MKNAIYFIGLAFALLLAAASCQKAPFLTFNGQKSFTFKDTGGSETITFSCNRAWTAKSSESWLTVSPAQGDANEEGVRVTITCAANTTYDPRNATVTIMSEGLTETISVSQETNYGLMSEPTTFNLTNAAQNIEVEVKANVEYTIAIDDACKDWISQVGTKALSSTKLTFSIAANESYDDREGKITISQASIASSVQPQVIIVKQSQTNGLFITTPEYALSNESHDLSIEVKANIDYEVTSEADWIKYEASSTKALSATTFTLKVDKNETYDQRVGTVKVKGGGLEGIVTITQAENLGLFVSPTEVQISKDAQEVEVEVQANVEYDIIVPEEAKGMITTVKTEGGGTKALVAKKVRFGISENQKYEGREVSVTFKQKDGALSGTVKISQEQTDFLEVSPVKDSISYEGGEMLFSVTTNIEFTVAEPDEENWLTIGERQKTGVKDGLTTYEFKIAIDNNNDLTPRYACIYVKGDNNLFTNTFIVAQGGVPIINFANIVVKDACVKNFDTNYDGEISIIEARSVVSIGGIFTDKKWAITSFDELKEFTSVSTIADDAFNGLESLKSISLPPQLINIGNYAFMGCSSLENIIFPETLSTIGIFAFAGCVSLKTVTFHKGLSSIGAEAFNGCTSLSNIVFNNEPSSFESGIFNGCKALNNVTIPNTVVEIKDWAFRDCGLTEVVIPPSVEYIGAQAFGLNNSLAKVVCESTTPPILSSSSFSPFYSISNTAVLYVPIGHVASYSSWSTFFGGGIYEIPE